MLVTALVLMIVGAGRHIENQSVELAAKLRTLPELAQELSVQGRQVSIAPELRERLAVVALHRRPWPEAASLLEKGLGLKFTSLEEGSWRIEEDPAASARKLAMYNAFLREAEGHYGRVFKEFRKFSQGQVPPDLNYIEALIQEKIREAPPKPGLYEGHQLFNCSAPPDDISALALLYGTASSSVPDFKLSGPTLYHLMKGNAVKALVAGDLIDEGNGYFWRDWRDLPEYIRFRAVAHIRNLETQLAKMDLTVQEKQRRLDEKARNINVAHRLRFDPVEGAMKYEFSVLEDPSVPPVFRFGQSKEEVLTGLNLKGTVSGGKDGNFVVVNTLSVTGAGDRWYDASSVRALRLPMDVSFLKRIETSAEVAEEIGSRMTRTTQTLQNARWKRPLPTSVSRSLAEGWVRFAESTQSEVVAQVQPIRDAWVRPTTAASLAAWISEGKPDNGKQVPAWTVEEDRGVWLVRDEWAFLDEKYPLDLKPVLELKRSAEDGITPLAALQAYCREVTPSQNAQFARISPAFGDPWAARAYPFIRFFDKLSPKMRSELFANLRKGWAYKIPLAKIGLQPKLVLMNELRQVCSVDPAANTADGAMHHSVFHPGFQTSITSGILTVHAIPLDLRSGPKVSLRFELRPGEDQDLRNEQGDSGLLITMPTVYMEVSGPVEIP